MTGINASIQMQKQRAAVLLQSNRIEDARKILTRVCTGVGKDAEAWYMLGAANSMLGLYAEGAQACRRR